MRALSNTVGQSDYPTCVRDAAAALNRSLDRIAAKSGAPRCPMTGGLNAGGNGRTWQKDRAS